MRITASEIFVSSYAFCGEQVEESKNETMSVHRWSPTTRITSLKSSSTLTKISHYSIFRPITAIFVIVLIQPFIVSCNSKQMLNQQEERNGSLFLFHKMLLSQHVFERQKRFSFFGDEVKPGNYCSNGGTFHHGKCQCRYP